MSRFFLLLWALLVFAPACGGADVKRSGGTVTLEPHNPADDYVISRAVYDRVLRAGPSAFMQQITVEPVLHGREFRGFLLLSFFPTDPAFSNAGVYAGDIIQRVNEQPVGRPDQFMAAWEGLVNRDALVVELVRNGEALIITWVIR